MQEVVDEATSNNPMAARYRRKSAIVNHEEIS